MIRCVLGSLAIWLLTAATLFASEADLAIPDLNEHGSFTIVGQRISAGNLLFYGSFVIAGTLGISLYLRNQIKILPAHKSMLDISEIIFQTCKTYLIQQGKFLAMLFVIINDVIPESRLSGNGTFASIAMVFGFILMTVLDTALS